jgi:sulfate adenylyltransferase
MLAMGAFSPLNGFMGQQDYREVVDRMQLCNGVLWPIPITVSVTREQSKKIRIGQDIVLADEHSLEALAIMTVEEIFPYDRAKEAREVFGTQEEAHPGVRRIYSQGE